MQPQRKRWLGFRALPSKFSLSTESQQPPVLVDLGSLLEDVLTLNNSAIVEKVAKVIGKVTIARGVRVWHPAIDRLLKEDETRREKQSASPYPMSLNEPPFDLLFERRRLHILNSLLLAVGRMKGKPSFYGHEARECHVSSLSNMSVSLSINQNNRVGAATSLPQAGQHVGEGD